MAAWRKRKSATIAAASRPARKVVASKSFSSADRVIPSITVTQVGDIDELPISDDGISTESELYDDHYENAAEKLYRTVSSVAAPTFPMGRALSVMLEEVENDDTLDAEGLLHRVHERKMTDAMTTRNSIALLTRGCEENVRNLLIPPEMGRKFSRQESTISTTSGPSFVKSMTDESADILGQNLKRSASNDDGQEEIHQIARYFKVFQENVDLDNFEKLIGSATVKNSLEIIVDFFLENVQREWGYLFDLIVPIKQLHALMVIGLLQLISLKGFLYYVPFLLLYGSFFSFIYFSLQLLHTKHSLDDFIAWRRLLNIFKTKNSDKTTLSQISADSNLEDIHWRCCSKVFFSLTIFLLSFQHCGFDEKSSSRLFILLGLSCLCTAMATLETFDSKNRSLNITSFTVGILFFLSKTCDTLFACCGTRIKISQNFEAKINILSLSYVICLIIYVYEFCKIKNSEKKYFVAYILCFLWWLTSLTLLESIHWSNLEKIDILLAISMAWLYLSPKFGIFVFSCVSFFWYSSTENSTNFLKTFFTFIVIIAPLVISKFFALFTSTDQQNSGTLRLLRNRKNLLIIFYGFLVVISAMFMYRGNMMPNFDNDSQNRTLYSNLSWDQFEKICDLDRRLENETGSKLQHQIECLELNNVPIFWSGVIKNVKIVKIDNFFETIFSFLPEQMSHWLACLYGSRHEPPTDQVPPPRPCTLRQHNVYTFHIEIDKRQSKSSKTKGTSKFSTIILVASDFFKHVIGDWNINRTVEFAAKFDGYPYQTPVKLKLIHMKIKPPKRSKNTNQSVTSEAQVAEERRFGQQLKQSIIFLVKFFFSPLIHINSG